MSNEVNEYHSKRIAFIDEERSLRRENVVLKARSSNEAEADAKLRQIRAKEAETIWKEEYPDIKHPFPGMEFLTGKKIIEKTRVFEILSKMPKGALLHAHLDATVNAKFLLELALKHSFFYVKVEKPLTATNLKTNLPIFRALPASQFTDHASLTNKSYGTGTWVSLQNARSNFAPEFGGPEGFDKWVIGSLTIDPVEAYDTYNTVDKIWSKFTSTFLTSTGLIRVEPIWRAYIKEFFLTSIEDGVSYIEVRINFLYKLMIGANGQEDIPHRNWVLTFKEVVEEVKGEMRQQGREDEFIGGKIIYSTIKSITPEEMNWYTEDCIALKKEFPDLIIGFDLVGPEDKLKPLIYYIEPLLRFRERQKEEGVDIPFIFHAGETLGDGTEADVNLYDAILLGTKRIGHGFAILAAGMNWAKIGCRYSLIKHPKLVEICRERGIAVEVCPISNEILRLTSSMLMHPLPALLNNGVPVALCSDDPAVFGNMGLTFDFYQVLVASEVNGLSTLGALARDSIEFSMLGETEKAAMLDVFERRWGAYVEYVRGIEV